MTDKEQPVPGQDYSLEEIVDMFGKDSIFIGLDRVGLEEEARELGLEFD